MPILPTYSGVTTSIPGQATADIPSDPFTKQLGQLGKSTENLGTTLTEVMRRRDALDDEAASTQRALGASRDLESLTETFDKPEIGYNAKKVFADTVEQKKAEWYKGLSPGASASLDAKLGPKLLEYQRHAYKIEHQNRADAYEAVGQDATRSFVEMQSRRTGPDDGSDTKEMTDLKSYWETGVKAGLLTRAQADHKINSATIAGATSRALRALSSDDPAVVQNAINVFEIENNKPIYMADVAPAGLIAKGNINLADRPVVKNADGSKSTVRSMSFQDDSGHEVLVPTVSDDGRIMSNEEAIQQYYKTGKMLGVFQSPDDATAYGQTLHTQQEALYNGTGNKSGNTYLKNIPADKRAELERQTKSHGEHLQSMAYTRKERERQETDRQNKELSEATMTLAEQKLRDPGKYGELTHEWLDQAASLRLMTPKDLEVYHVRTDAVKASGTSQTGGLGEPEFVGSITREVHSATTPAEVAAASERLKQGIIEHKIPAGPGQSGIQLLDVINAKSKEEGGANYSKRQEATDAKARLKHVLNVSGPFATGPLKNNELIEEERVTKLIDEDAKNGYPKGALRILEEEMPVSKARVGVVGRTQTNATRRQMGLPTDPKLAVQSLDDRVADLADKLKALPPDESGNASRRALRKQLRELKDLDTLERAMADYEVAKSASKAQNPEASGSSAGSVPTKSSGPSMGPRK
jgi:hypothetical protein